MKGDENLAEVQLSCSFFDARTGGRVADRVNRKGEAFDRAGGLSGRLSIRNEFSGYAVSMPEDAKPERAFRSKCARLDKLKHVLPSAPT
jgi:hypothetical protein